MKKSIIILLVFAATYSYGQQPTRLGPGMNIDSFMKAKQTQAIDKPFPLFSSYFDGKVFNNENLKGKTVFINFWFAACAPCIAEMDALNDLYARLKSNKNFEFISFTFETPEKTEQLIQQYKIQYKVFSLEEADCRRLNLNAGFPTSIILDSGGMVKYFKNGGTTDKAEAKRFVFAEFYPKIVSLL